MSVLTIEYIHFYGLYITRKETIPFGGASWLQHMGNSAKNMHGMSVQTDEHMQSIDWMR